MTEQRVVMRLGFQNISPGVVLPPINQQQLRTELELLGMPAELAAQKAALAGQSFTSFQYSVLKFPFLG